MVYNSYTKNIGWIYIKLDGQSVGAIDSSGYFPGTPSWSGNSLGVMGFIIYVRPGAHILSASSRGQSFGDVRFSVGVNGRQSVAIGE